MKRSDFRLLDRLRVRWAEVDMQRIVFNGHYLMYFDTAVASYWRALAMPYHETMEALAGDLFVRKATLEYQGSARYDELCEVGVRCAKIGRSSMVFSAALFRGETALVHGELVYVFADPAAQASRAVPVELRRVLEAFEAGEAMLELRSGPWSDLGARARALRRAVFGQELRIALPLDEDAADGAALHVLALNRFGQAVGTGRLLTEGPGVARIARLAVLAALRGSGVGSALVRELTTLARQRGNGELVLAAQAGAVDFYGRLGFMARGEVFEEAGLPHQEMLLLL